MRYTIQLHHVVTSFDLSKLSYLRLAGKLLVLARGFCDGLATA
jgi:hypothetical protein